MPTPLPHQIEGAQFLASRRAALLADDPRVGKTGAAIMACDLVLARRVLVVTTATGRANFGREFREWQAFPRVVQVLFGASDAIDPAADVLVVGWSVVADKRLQGRLAAWKADVLVLDESHYARSPEAKRCVAAMALAHHAARVFCLTGTPMPNGPHELWPVLYTVAPERIDRMHYHEFVRRYCVVKPRFMTGKRVDVIIGGRNLEELRDRLNGFWLRRTQADVGIREPVYSMLSLPCDPKLIDRMILAEVDQNERVILNAIAEDRAAQDDIHLAELMRVTGTVKAIAVAELVLEELKNGLDKVVLMCWHTEVVDQLAARLSTYGVAVLDGRTPPQKRQDQIAKFQSGQARVFIGQIRAAGEGIDLSTSCNLIFVEASWAAADMRQAALRVTNHGQKRQCLVRFAALAGSIDEAVVRVVTRKVATIKRVLSA